MTATWKKPNFMFYRGRKGDVTWDDLQRRFLAQDVQRYNIVATSFRKAAALFQHLNPVLR